MEDIKERLVTCHKCGSNACHEAYNDRLIVWSCFGCGFTTNSTMTDENVKQTEELFPELYKALRFRDKEGLNWYPTALTFDDKSMVFAEGTSIEDWKWSAVQAKEGKPDMTTKKEFKESDFMEALDYIEYFNKK